MERWKDPTAWLLEDENPSVRYLTLTTLLDRPEDAPEVQKAKRKLMETGLVPEILRLQSLPEYLETYPRYYTYKYKGLVWTLITLAELGAEVNEQIKEACEYLLENSQERTDGGFSENTAVRTGGGRINEVYPCLSGNMVWSLIHFGYLEDPRVQKGIDWITRFMRFNDGIALEVQLPPYDRNEPCWGSHTCHMGVVKTLKALSSIPVERRSEDVTKTIGKAVEFLLSHHIYKRSHDLSKVSKPGWLKFGFPLMYQTDILEILDILTALGVKDRCMEEAVNLVLLKQDAQGCWKAENTYNSDRLLIPMGKLGEPNKWITLRAMRVLKRYYGT